jgi:hypothetical protein
MRMRPPPLAMAASNSPVLSSFRNCSKGPTYSSADVSGTSRPSSSAWTRTFFTPSVLARTIMALRWLMCECTLPSENSPRKCNVEECCFTLLMISFQPSRRNSSPFSIASETSAAPCVYTWPEPMALCPTSELPMSASEGMPTAVPWALSTMFGYLAKSLSSVGLRAAAMALPT